MTTMLEKPETCKGCPWYGDGTGYVPDRLVAGAKVLILAQNPGEDEERGRKVVEYVGQDRVYNMVGPQPLIGPTGYALEHTYLPAARLSPEEVSYANVLKCRYKHTNVLPSGETLHHAVSQCTTQHLVIPPETRLIVAHGQLAWDYFHQGQYSITKWRGYLSPTYPHVYATLHTASIFRDPRMKPAALADWRKIPRILNGTWPEPVPHLVQMPAEEAPTWDAVMRCLEGVDRVALDTEYTYTRGRHDGSHPLTVIGVAGRHRETGEWRGFQIDCRLLPREHVQDVVRNVLTPCVLQRLPVIFQNMGADVPVLRGYGAPGWEGYHQVEDLMLLHFALYSEQPHDLEYLASLAGVLPKMKHLVSEDLLTYNKGDVIETYACFEAFEKEARQEPAVYTIYREELLPLVPIHQGATARGIKVNRKAVVAALRRNVEQIQEATRLAQAYAGFPINLGSVGGTGQVAAFLYGHLGLPAQKNRETRQVTVDSDAIAALRRLVGPEPDFERESREGFSIEDAQVRVDQGANPLLEARVVYAAALQEVSHYLAPLIQGEET